MVELPSGTVTFLFTDLEGSARLWDEHPEAMRTALSRHDEILREVIAAHDGHVVKTTGDGVHAVFATAHEGVAAAVSAQRAIAEEDFGELGELRIRIGVHTGPAEVRDGDYYGSAVNRAARLMGAAHGGQIVVSLATEELVRDLLFDGVALEDLGEHRFRGLSRSERVFGVIAPGLRSMFPPLHSVDAHRTNLPVQVSSFVGRADDVEKVQAALRQSRVVTLTGVGGVGKTRLALEAAATMLGEFTDGVWVCELASVSTLDAVDETLASTLSVQPALGRDLREALLEHLAARRVLLVLDNCEHLLDAAARLVDVVQRRCSDVTVLATSREGLGVAGEQMVAVTSLGVPADNAGEAEIAESEAARLFCERARSAKSDFKLTDGNAAAVGVICRRLDGIPLAIELAAACVRALPPNDIVDRLDQRFRLLTRGSRASLERHQTLRATIDWSYNLLDEGARDALNALSVFAGGCGLQAAEAVLSSKDLDALDVVDVLTRLVDKSLLLADENDDRVRYRLLETIRQYAQEQLEATGDAAPVRRRHADYYVSRAEAVGPSLRSSQELNSAQEAARETDNFRTALEWALEEPSLDHAMRLLAPLAVQGIQVGYAAMEWAGTACDMEDADGHPLFPTVASGAAYLAAYGGNFERARVLVERIDASELALGERTAAACLGAANLAFYTGDLELARARSEEWVTLARASGDRYQLARALLSLGAAMSIAGDTEAGLAALADAVDVARDAGISTVLAIALTAMAIFMSPEDPRALAALDEAIEVGTRIGDRQAVSTAAGNKGWFAARNGDWRSALQASQNFDEMRLEFKMSIASSPGAFALTPVALVQLGRLEPASVILGHYEAVARNMPGPQWSLTMVDAARDTLTELVSSNHLQALFARGAALLPEEAATYLQIAITAALHDLNAKEHR